MNRSALVAATAAVLLMSACATPRHQSHEEQAKPMNEHCKDHMAQMHAAHAAAGAASAPAAHECRMMKKG